MIESSDFPIVCRQAQFNSIISLLPKNKCFLIDVKAQAYKYIPTFVSDKIIKKRWTIIILKEF